MLPGRKPPIRTEPYTDDELRAHDRKLAKYFVAGGFFLVLGSVHMVVKNVPAIAEALARMGYAGHLVRDLSSTHVMIVGGGTLLATGLTWRVLPRIVGRPLASEGLAQAAFWLTALGLGVFYVSLVGERARDRTACRARLGVPGREGAHGQALQGPDRRRCRDHGPRLLVLRGERLPDDLPVPAREGAEAAVAPVEVPRDRCGGAHGRHGAGSDPGAAGQRRLAVQGRTRGRVDRPDQPRAHQPRHGADDARRRCAVRAPARPTVAAGSPTGPSAACSAARSRST